MNSWKLLLFALNNFGAFSVLAFLRACMRMRMVRNDAFLCPKTQKMFHSQNQKSSSMSSPREAPPGAETLRSRRS